VSPATLRLRILAVQEFVPAKVVVACKSSSPASVWRALSVSVAVPVISQLFQVVAPANVLLPAIVRVEPVAVTVPAVLVKVTTVQVIAPAKVYVPVPFRVIAVPDIVPAVNVAFAEPARVVVPATQFVAPRVIPAPFIVIVVVPAVVNEVVWQALERVIVEVVVICKSFQVIPLVARVVAAGRRRIEVPIDIVPAVYVKVLASLRTVPDTVIVPAELKVRLFFTIPVPLHVPVPFITIEAVPVTFPVDEKPIVSVATFILNKPLIVMIDVVAPRLNVPPILRSLVIV